MNGMRRLRVGGVVIMALLFCRTPLFAAGNIPLTQEQSLGNLLGYGFPVNPMKKGVLEFRIAPAFLRYKDMGSSSQINLSGWGAASAVTYGISDHWGFGFFVGGETMRGTRNFNPTPPGSAAVFSSLKIGCTVGQQCDRVAGDSSGRGIVLAGSVIYDPMRGERFRLPISFGLGYVNVKETGDNSSVGFRRVGELKSPAIFFGIAPQFKVWKFRVTTFAFSFGAKDNATGYVEDYDPATGGTINKHEYAETGDDTNSVKQMGIDFTYMPWGLGFTYIPDYGEGASSYSVKWAARFGD